MIQFLQQQLRLSMSTLEGFECLGTSILGKNEEKMFLAGEQGRMFDGMIYLQTNPEKNSNKFFIQKEIERTDNSRILKLKGIKGCEVLIAKITQKFQTQDSHAFHQFSQIQFLTKLKSSPTPYLVRIQAIFFHQSKLFCLMEFLCAGDLSLYITKNSCLSTKQEKNRKLYWVKNIVKQIIQSLSLVHSMGYVYRDLKPSNLLVTHQGKIKLCDFGFVIKQGEIDSSLCGTPHYMSPERLSDRKKTFPVDYSVDMWSLGILTYELLIGETPFRFQGNIKSLLDELYSGYISFDEDFPENARHFIFNLLQTNPKKRLTIKAASQHPFLSDQIINSEEEWWTCKCQK